MHWNNSLFVCLHTHYSSFFLFRSDTKTKKFSEKRLHFHWHSFFISASITISFSSFLLFCACQSLCLNISTLEFLGNAHEYFKYIQTAHTSIEFCMAFSQILKDFLLSEVNFFFFFFIYFYKRESCHRQLM